MRKRWETDAPADMAHGIREDGIDKGANRWPDRLFAKKTHKTLNESRITTSVKASDPTVAEHCNESSSTDQSGWEATLPTVSGASETVYDSNTSVNIRETVQSDKNTSQAQGKPLSEMTNLGLELQPICSGCTRNVSSNIPHPLRKLETDIKLAQDGLDAGNLPELTKTGTGGSYFLRAPNGSSVAVFKPVDEEPCGPNNPRGIRGSSSQQHGLKKGVRPGEGAIREVAAYLLDHHNFAGVPPTAMVCCQAKNKTDSKSCLSKMGSLQKFVVSDSDCEELGPSAFSVQQVHKICVLDIRFANADRNGANILARRQGTDGGWDLIPIDHGYCFPDTFEDICFEWKYWRQAKQPFSKETLEYISKLDAESDIKTLKANGITLSDECQQVFRASTMLLKKAAVRGLTPYDISGIACREGFEPSPLETLYQVASAVYKTGECSSVHTDSKLLTEKTSDGDRLMATLGVLLDEYLANEVKKN